MVLEQWYEYINVKLEASRFKIYKYLWMFDLSSHQRKGSKTAESRNAVKYSEPYAETNMKMELVV